MHQTIELFQKPLDPSPILSDEKSGLEKTASQRSKIGFVWSNH